ncbi:MAG: diaminopimelate decarboxylase [Planctomycetota bacterium]|jgi:diaminopimelate decarboxylase|nr:MAG: diaminopimelate decarboxylase [Planctomycetota bacterium]
MDLFEYRNGELFAENLPVRAIAEAAGTPCYIYSRGTLESHYDRLVEAFAPIAPLVCYSVKSCPNLSVLKVLHERGAGMDVVSGGELFRARAAGVDAKKCVYAGVGKTDREITYALKEGIGLFNCESEEEFENIARIARENGIVARVALRINPDVDPKTHRYTTTGKKESKFGVDLERARRFFEKYGRDEFALLEGLHLHIGSPVYTVDPYREALTKTASLVDDLARAGFTIRSIDLGGGFGADYESSQTPPLREYAQAIIPLAKPLFDRGIRFILEPGRTIVANAGILVVEVLYTKTSGEKRFAICNAGMNALLRPSHYGSFHFMWPVVPGLDMTPARRTLDPKLPGTAVQDVVGPLCETGDFLALDRALPASLSRGDLLAVFTAGAYGMSMANRYNSSPLPSEVLVSGSSAHIVRSRENFQDLIEHELQTSALNVIAPLTNAPELTRTAR